MPQTLQTSVRDLFQVGPIQTKRLAKLGISTLNDLLYHFPFRYEDFSVVKNIAEISMNEPACLRGTLTSIGARQTRSRKSIIEALLTDDTGSIKLVWFNQPYLLKNLSSGDEIVVCGTPQFNHFGPHIASPEYEKASDNLVHTGRIVPIYPSTERLSSKWLRSVIKRQLSLTRLIKDYFPAELKKSYNLMDLGKSIQEIHFPRTQQTLARARYRLGFDELFFVLLAAKRRRAAYQKQKAYAFPFDKKIAQQFVHSLAFTLTNAQKKGAWEILQDMEKSQPMNRLLEGDVGSGKTVVATMGIISCLHHKKKALFMAPTEILACQHEKSISNMLSKIFHDSRHIALFSHSYATVNGKKISKELLKQKIKHNKIDLVIGTHAILYNIKHMRDLGLVIVDEQHRFGVNQRKELQNREFQQSASCIPHFLSMTATPIPRTLALTLYGDLDISIIDEMPTNRKSIQTRIVPPKKRDDAYKFIKKQITIGRQAFVICPLIDESDTLGVKSVTVEHKKLHSDIFPDLVVEKLHGKMKSSEKQRIITAFSKGLIDILVSTSVVEVGIDIPNATIMMIEGAERFGLAQLHQFRGRVGRGVHQSFCLLFSDGYAPETRARLKAVEQSTNGFELAQKDLELRGPGDLYGSRQSGVQNFKIACLTDQTLIARAESATNNIAHYDINKWPLLAKKIETFERDVHFE